MKKILYLLSSAFLYVMINNSCVNDESTQRQNSNRFFNSSGVLDEHVLYFVSQLSLKNDSADFVTSFVEKYGFPLWEESYSFPIEGRWVYAIPVKRDGQIGSIWFFDGDGQKIKYFMFSRKNATGMLEECSWMFDYFDVKLSLYKPKRKGEKMVFVERPIVDTRIFVEVEHCNDIYIGTEGHLEYQYTHCWTTYEYLFWTMAPFGDGSGGDGQLPFYGGGGGGGNNASSAPYAQAMFRNSTTSDPNWKKIEDMLVKIMGTCIGKYLYYSLLDDLKGGKLILDINSGSGGSFGEVGGGWGISIGLQMESNQLLHEMFHALQAYRETFESRDASGLNREYEAHYAQYIYLNSLLEYAGSKWETMYNDAKRYKEVKYLENLIDKRGNLLTGVSEERLETYLTNDLKAAFRLNKYPESGYSYDDKRYGLANFKNIRELTKKCN